MCNRQVLAFLKSGAAAPAFGIIIILDQTRTSGSNRPPTLQSARTSMSEHYIPAMIDACTQTPFPGSELLDPNPFVKSPSKAKPASARETFGPTLHYVEEAVCMKALPRRGTTSP